MLQCIIVCRRQRAPRRVCIFFCVTSGHLRLVIFVMDFVVQQNCLRGFCCVIKLQHEEARINRRGMATSAPQALHAPLSHTDARN
jgi:hypothetical protein